MNPMENAEEKPMVRKEAKRGRENKGKNARQKSSFQMQNNTKPQKHVRIYLPPAFRFISFSSFVCALNAAKRVSALPIYTTKFEFIENARVKNLFSYVEHKLSEKTNRKAWTWQMKLTVETKT